MFGDGHSLRERQHGVESSPAAYGRGHGQSGRPRYRELAYRHIQKYCLLSHTTRLERANLELGCLLEGAVMAQPDAREEGGQSPHEKDRGHPVEEVRGHAHADHLRTQSGTDSYTEVDARVVDSEHDLRVGRPQGQQPALLNRPEQPNGEGERESRRAACR